ncbi:MAG: ABC transporter permease [Spirochaetales bacterium]
MSARKYATVFGIAGRDQLIYLPTYLLRSVFFLIILFIFFSLWRVIYSSAGVIAGFTITQTLWYLTFTETIEMSQTRLFAPISAEVKDGSVAYSLVRPYSYVAYWVSRGMGENLVKMVPLLAEGFLLATILVGPLPGYLEALPFGLIVVIGGILMGSLLQVVIGLLAFWFEEVTPFWWILQKITFVIGGLFLPIDFYPEWLQGVARATPFAFLAYWPASTWVSFSWERFATTLLGQVGFIVALSGIAALIFKRAVFKLQAQGG